ncbi:hypothetical protein V7968_32685 [Nocardia vulneris]|uniref:hypothetical protein n=1 Tax=Nocardia vulneris TaxID=1141657 RepID=UPI0030CF9C9E
MTDYDRKLNNYRAALEAGTDPQLMPGWTRQVQAERDVATGQLLAMETTAHVRPILNRNEIRELVKVFGGLIKILRAADPTTSPRSTVNWCTSSSGSRAEKGVRGRSPPGGAWGLRPHKK